MILHFVSSPFVAKKGVVLWSTKFGQMLFQAVIYYEEHLEKFHYINRYR
jgi:hypothetical protein